MYNPNFKRPQSAQSTSAVLKQQFQLLRDRYSPGANQPAPSQRTPLQNYKNSALTVSQLTPQPGIPTQSIPICTPRPPKIESGVAQIQPLKIEHLATKGTPQSSNVTLHHAQQALIANLSAKIASLQSQLSFSSNTALETVPREKFDEMRAAHESLERDLRDELRAVEGKLRVCEQKARNMRQQQLLQQNEFETKILDAELRSQNKIIQYQLQYNNGFEVESDNLWKGRFELKCQELATANSESSARSQRQGEEIEKLREENQKQQAIISNGVAQYNSLKDSISHNDESFQVVKEEAIFIIKELQQLSNLSQKREGSQLSMDK
ncbi:hypothetical protein SS50377_23912 [Spironucleus salmonicida]|uniref:Uncharacterized protein n=1 Tax=Spironucleus salmonicida TaxID=348837 RepID=V6LVN8_9EUKA|nr:hypothetical protein SS50377_23912 [Spironucleus salmonicida]|eukprot:EST48308.1 Hypothetical protein SS50377_11509 [Spironucleus salmonicida]